MSNPNFGEFAAKGAAASGKLQKDRSIENYLKKPQICEMCNEIIPLKANTRVSQFRNDRYCNLKCAALGRWREKRIREGLPEPKKFGPWINTLPFREKKDVNKTQIYKNSREVYLSKYPEPSCENCKIDNFDLIDIAHKRAISDFDDTAKIFEINNIENLMALCKNCHWLHDLQIPGRKGTKKRKKPQESLPGAL